MSLFWVSVRVKDRVSVRVKVGYLCDCIDSVGLLFMRSVTTQCPIDTLGMVNALRQDTGKGYGLGLYRVRARAKAS